MNADVVIVGAGPVGLMLACELRLAGVDVLVVERRETGTQGESRAPGINARTLEILSQRGLGTRFRDIGRIMNAVVFSGMPVLPGVVDPEWPDGLIIAQSKTESILAERAVESGARLCWSTELLHLTQNAQGVELTVQTDGKVSTIRAQYVVGCDGGHSVVRRLSHIKFPGEDPQSHWLVADVKLDEPPADGTPFGRNERIGSFQVSRVEPDWYRISLMTVQLPVDRTAPVTLEELRQAMLEGIGTDYGLTEARWMSRFTDGFRQAEHYRNGRVFIAGDAAHIHSPIGGQGLNLGIQDAVNLGWKLAAVLNYGASPELLDSYESERQPAGCDAINLARGQTLLIKPGRQAEALRATIERLIAIPEVVQELAGEQSGLALQYAWGKNQHPLLGRRMPDMCVLLEGQRTKLYELMKDGRPLWIQFGSNISLDAPASWQDWVKTVRVESLPGEEGFNWRFPVYGSVPAIRAVLIRPDGYVAGISDVNVTDMETMQPASEILTYLG
ncbi:FAD-dependent oxidoreductase [Thalassolituus sp. LLYu03]|uniref:FAD-dependent oxidoreductase n=1 Tax=Thalassolituus sp. LLYu03 TaxID=3421656 RepID=UPI003D29A34D